MTFLLYSLTFLHYWNHIFYWPLLFLPAPSSFVTLHWHPGATLDTQSGSDCSRFPRCPDCTSVICWCVNGIKNDDLLPPKLVGLVWWMAVCSGRRYTGLVHILSLDHSMFSAITSTFVHMVGGLRKGTNICRFCWSYTVLICPFLPHVHQLIGNLV